MIEDLAIEAIWAMAAPGSLVLPVAVGGLVLCGGAAGILRQRDDRTLARIPFLALNLLLALAYALFLLVVSRVAILALIFGCAWLIVGVGAVGTIAYGHAVGRAAAQRGLGAFGSRWAGLLAFVPVANIALVFKRGQVRNTRPAAVFLTGRRGLAIGLLTLAAVLSVLALLPRVERLGSYREHQVAMALFDHEIRFRGAGSTARNLAAQVQTPVVISNDLTLTRFESDGAMIRRDFTVTLNDGAASDAPVRGWLLRDTCNNDRMMHLMRAGVRLEDRFSRDDSGAGEVVTVDRATCDALPGMHSPGT